jgi:hypothetical protein
MKYFLFALFTIFAIAKAQQSLCDKYSVLLNVTNVELMTNVVIGTFTAVTQSGTETLPFFNGMVPAGSFNYLTNQTGANILVGGLVAFFGAALGCTQVGFPTYTGGAMDTVHAAMPITFSVFSFFNDQLIGVLAQAGVTIPDQNTISSVLYSFNPSICNQPDCVMTTNAITSAAVTSGSSITSGAVTSSQITSASFTSNAVTSNAVTSNAGITSNVITSSAVTSSRVTSSAVTSNRVTSNAINTSGRMTTLAQTSFASALIPTLSLLIASFFL